MPTTLTIPLASPLTVGQVKIDQIVLTEPTGAEMQAAEKAAEADTLVARTNGILSLLSSVTGIAEDVLVNAPTSVARQAAEFFSQFTKDVPVTVPTAATMTIDLDVPLTVQGIPYERLELHEPTIGQRRQAEVCLNVMTPENMRRYQMVLVSKGSGIPYAAVEKMPVSVLNRAEAFLRGFSLGGPQTGSP